jgi:phosphatidylserine synthase 2
MEVKLVVSGDSLQNIDPNVGVELPEKAYGTDCRLWIPGEGLHLQVLKDTLFDEFVIAHTLGWWAKALLIRNFWVLSFLSIGFELMELTFQHWLLNFNECWWDSWILDVAVCNLGGMLIGMKTVEYFGSKNYDWQGISQQQGLYNKARYAAWHLDQSGTI